MQRFAQNKRIEVVSKQATKVTAISARLEWRIEQFEKLMKLFKNGQNLISKQFSCPQSPTVLWELHVYPNGKREEDTGNVSFFLRQVGLQRGEDPIMTEFQIYTLDANECRISVCRDTKDFSNQQGRGKFQVHREKMLAALRTDGSLLLVCEVEYLPPGSRVCIEQEEPEKVLSFDEFKLEDSLKDSLREMWQTELFTDCVIQVGSSKIPAHRCILGQHSAVFRSMFSQKAMSEAQNGIITIIDSRPEYVRAMLEFIYTGTIDKTILENHAQGILAISDKYAINNLKEICERYLASTITNKNVTTMVVIADTYFANLLKNACAKFMYKHHKFVIRSPEWKELKCSRGVLANELLESVLDCQGGSDDGADLDDQAHIHNSSSTTSSVESYTFGSSSGFGSSQTLSASSMCFHNITPSTSQPPLINDVDRIPTRKRPRRRL